MSGTTNSEDYNDVVNSDGGTNVMPALICNSHFFLDTVSGSDFTSAFSQASNHEFGAVPNTTQFRTSSKITVTGTGSKKLRAICNGQVFLQPVTGAADKVNLILKPSEQPIPTLGVKYFIFRNLPLDQFFEDGSFEGDTVKMIKTRSSENDSAVSEFVNHLWNQFEAYNSMSDLMPAFLAKYIGFISGGELPTEGVFPDEKLLDEVFFKISSQVAEVPNPDLEGSTATGTDADSDTESEENTNDTIEVLEEVLDEAVSYELPLVFKGMTLCELSGDTISIDVVLDYGDYIIPNDPNPFKMNLAFARSADHILDTSSITFETDDSQERKDYLTKLYKESCTQFIDICAFYGLHAEAGKLYANGDNATVLTQDNLVNAISGFQSKHTIYLYIQANRQRSYNFYGNYEHPDGVSGNINIGTDPDNLTNTRFDESGWPLYELDYNLGNNLYLELLSNNQTGNSIYVLYSKVLSKNEMNFVFNENLNQHSSIDLNDNSIVRQRYSKPINLAITSSSSTNNNICSVLTIICLLKELWAITRNAFPTFEGNEGDLLKHALSDYDDLFDRSYGIQIKGLESENNHSVVVDKKLRLLNLKDLRNDFSPSIQSISSSIHPIANSEHELCIYQTQLYANLSSKVTNWPAIDSEPGKQISKSNYEFLSVLEKKSLTQGITRVKLSFGQKEMNAIKLVSGRGKINSKVLCCLTSSDLENFNQLESLSGLNHTKIVWYTNESTKLTSYEGIAFEEYPLGICGENQEGLLVKYELNDFPKLYSIDNYIFFSEHFCSVLTETSHFIRLISNYFELNES